MLAAVSVRNVEVMGVGICSLELGVLVAGVDLFFVGLLGRCTCVLVPLVDGAVWVAVSEIKWFVF